MFPLHKFPYTNFHDLNLDWILNKIKEIETKIEEGSVPQSLLDDVAQLKEKVVEIQQSINTLNSNLENTNQSIEDLEHRVEVIENQPKPTNELYSNTFVVAG